MHIFNLSQWKHTHRFSVQNKDGERNTKRVILLTVIMMAVEIGAGCLYKSMALLADGWHMGTHAAALGITVFAYSYARRNADNPSYSFGTGKVGALGGFTSAIVLAIVALLAGKMFDWVWMDPMMGIVGAVVITVWAYGLLCETSKTLLDSGVEAEMFKKIRTVIEADSDNRVSDLHIWRVGPQSLAIIISIVTHHPKHLRHYKDILSKFKELVHVSVEINAESGESCVS